MRHDAVMFDLDGTLADTLGDIAACGNHMLTTLGRAPLPLDRYRYLAGQGVRYLVRTALAVPDEDPQVERGIAVFRAYQDAHGMDLAKPYAGIAELLDVLASHHVKLAVLSNKPHTATRAMVAQVFDRWRFNAVQGQVDGRPHKPDPAGALAIVEALHVPAPRWLYVGDTAVDMQTARGAGMTAVGVLWGFRDEAELREHGAAHIVAHPGEIVRLL